MATQRQIDMFSAGCPVCEHLVTRIKEMACPSRKVPVLDMKESDVAARGRKTGIRSIPAVVIDGDLADGRAGRGPDEAALSAAGLGRPLACRRAGISGTSTLEARLFQCLQWVGKRYHNTVLLRYSEITLFRH